MNVSFLMLYCALSFVNVVIQTLKSLCTVKSSTFVSAVVNAVAYGLYVYVIFFTNAEGLSLIGKAVITAAANFTGVYLASWLFNKVFNRVVRWKVEVSIPNTDAPWFIDELEDGGFEYYLAGHYGGEWTCYAVFCESKEKSKELRELVNEVHGAKYNVCECVKRL